MEVVLALLITAESANPTSQWKGYFEALARVLPSPTQSSAAAGVSVPTLPCPVAFWTDDEVKSLLAPYADIAEDLLLLHEQFVTRVDQTYRDLFPVLFDERKSLGLDWWMCG